MKYKLLAIDMDGTFLNGEHNVTQGNISAIKKAADKGMKVMICSGRIPSSLEMLQKYIPEHQALIIKEYSHPDVPELNKILPNLKTMSFWPATFTERQTENWIHNNIKYLF
jgi:hydroxymethylpyrimidine pyrophosphatase-like HAD family hydrolase